MGNKVINSTSEVDTNSSYVSTKEASIPVQDQKMIKVINTFLEQFFLSIERIRFINLPPCFLKYNKYYLSFHYLINYKFILDCKIDNEINRFCIDLSSSLQQSAFYINTLLFSIKEDYDFFKEKDTIYFEVDSFNYWIKNVLMTNQDLFLYPLKPKNVINGLKVY